MFIFGQHDVYFRAGLRGVVALLPNNFFEMTLPRSLAFDMSWQDKAKYQRVTTFRDVM